MSEISPSPPAPSPATGEGNRFHRDNVPAARRLRAEETASEKALWECLRGRRCAGLKFRRQHPAGRFVLDFYCEELRVAIEVDGGIHRQPAQKQKDEERQVLIEERGVRFIRIPAELVEGDRPGAMRFLVATLSALR